MNALKVLASPRIWLTVVGVPAVLALIFYAYLAAVVSPEENLEDLPVALVNEDRGGELGEERVDFGDRVVENVTDPGSPAAGTVEWARPGSREEALQGLGRKEYYGAIVVPADYSERISGIADSPEVPIAVVNEDAGADMGGRPVNLGDEVTKRITAPDSPAPPFVDWAAVEDREKALDGLEKGDHYAVIAIPKDYSGTLASMSGPPPGAVQTGALTGAPADVPPGAPTGAPPGSRPPAPEPAQIELLTSPAVRPSTTGLVENAFSGIVGGVSRATSERILGSLSEAGAPVPPGAGAIISDPVQGKVSEAEVSGEAGPLPVAPEPAEIEVLTNAAAGQTASTPVQNISTGIVGAVSRATSERISDAAGERGAQLPPEVATVVGDPVRANVIDAEPVGPDSGNGQSPFFLAFLANLSGLMGSAAVFFAVRGGANALAARGTRTSQTGLWTARLLVGLLYAALVAGVELWVAFGILGVEHDAGTTEVWAFLALAVAATVAVTMLLTAALGPAGIGIAAILTVLLGLVSSGGNAPLEALPGFYRAYADWLPLRYVIDGLRSLLFYDGSLDAARLEGGWRDSLWSLGGDGRSEAAGLEDAVWVLGAYIVGAAVLGYALSLLRDFLGNGRKNAKRGRKAAEPAAEAVG